MQNLHDILFFIRTEGALKNTLLRRPNNCYRYGRRFFDRLALPRITEGQVNTAIGTGKILIYGYPRSGNHWLTSLLRDLFDLENSPTTKWRQITLTHQYPTSRVGKLAMLYGSRTFRSTLLIRDPRDSIYSLYKLSSTKDWKDEGTYNLFTDIDKFYFDYWRPVYLPSRNPFEMWDSIAPYMPIIRYENLCSNVYEELKLLFQQWNIEVSEQRLSASIDKYPAINKQVSISEKLSPKVLNNFNSLFETDLKRWGYS